MKARNNNSPTPTLPRGEGVRCNEKTMTRLANCKLLREPSPRGRFWVGLLLLLFFFTLSSCSDDTSSSSTSQLQFTDYKVAVIMELDDVHKARFERTAAWALQNIEAAQRDYAAEGGLEGQTGVRLSLEWYDESTANMATLGEQLAAREDVVAIIGPDASTKLDTIASKCARSGKTIISPSATAEEIVRRYYTNGNLWTLTETDVTQCEMLLYKAQAKGHKTVSLISPDDAYGKTFYDWFAFEATEYGLTPVRAVSYNATNRDEMIAEVLADSVDCYICTPSTLADFNAIIAAYVAKYGVDDYMAPDLFFSDATMLFDLTQYKGTTPYIEGIAPYADPTTGFNTAYNVRFGTNPLGEEATLYDALTLTAFALSDCRQLGLEPTNGNMKTSMRRLFTPTDSTPRTVWEEVGLAGQFKRIASGQFNKLIGASGELEFDQSLFTNVLASTYCYWSFYDGVVNLIDYCNSNGSHRVTSTTVNWIWKKLIEEDFSDQSTGITYSAKDKSWALLVAADDSWKNYRFQADVLNMYQTLKANGYDDDHIILIAEDDLAQNASNPNPCTVIVEDGGKDLYAGAVIDYHPSNLTMDDLVNIFCGEKTSRTPEVISSDADDDVLVFWSGHGVYGRLCWLTEHAGYSKAGLTTDAYDALLQRMENEGRYRKMLWLVEACHAASVTSACEGRRGVLAFAAAGANETSKTANWSRDYGTYLSNIFTRNLMSCVQSDPVITFRSLYRAINRATLASHVEVDNAANFDNLYTSSIYEFLNP